MKYFFYFLLAAIVGIVGVLEYNTLAAKSRQPTAMPTENFTISSDAIEHLAEAVKCATNSYKDHVDTAEFKKLRALIDTTFPLCREKMQQKTIDSFSLVYKWTGKDTSLAPIILLAHLDVVPVEGAALNTWQQPPYGGVLADSYLWGRGTLDDKMSAFGILEAGEILLKKGFQPKQTIYFAFGHDEEVGGTHGAKAIVRYLDSAENVRNATVLDEGMVVLEHALPGLEPPVALIGIAEKGYLSLELKASTKGGHSSMPPNQTSIGLLSEAILKLEKNQCSASFTPPTAQLLDYVQKEMDYPYNIIMSNRWLTAPLLKMQFLKSPQTAGLLRTTTAPTIFNAGIKDNILPLEATATVNFRILPTENIDSVVAHVERVLKGSDIQIKILSSTAQNPSKITETNTPIFEKLGKLIRGIFKQAVIAPALVTAGTDSHHYEAIAKNTFRFSPIVFKNEDLARLHGVDERISVESYNRSIVFFYNLMKM